MRREWVPDVAAACSELLNLGAETPFDLVDPFRWLESHLTNGRRALIAALASDRQQVVASFLTDLGEILHLPREQRSEYRLHSGHAPPYRIRKLLLEYAVKAMRMDRHVGALTKSFCATQCDRLPTGCCIIQGYDLGLVPEVMLQVQALEARMRGWTPPEREAGCRYHTPQGCALVLFKSPACLGTLCAPLEDHLRTTYTREHVEPYLAALGRFRNCDIDRRAVFEAMDEAIATGDAVLELHQRRVGRLDCGPVRG